MEKIKSVIIIGILLTLIEVLCFHWVIEYTNSKYPFTWVGVGWGIYRHSSFLFFVFGISIVNLTLSITNKLKITIPITIVIIGIYIYLFHTAYDYRPNRVLLRMFLITGLSLFSFLVSYVYITKNKNTTQLII